METYKLKITELDGSVYTYLGTTRHETTEDGKFLAWFSNGGASQVFFTTRDIKTFSVTLEK